MFCIWEPHEECLLGSASSVRTRRHACARPRLRFGDLSPIPRNLPVRAPHLSQCKKAFFGVKSWLFGHQALFAKHQLRRYLPLCVPTGTHLPPATSWRARCLEVAPKSHRIRTEFAPESHRRPWTGLSTAPRSSPGAPLQFAAGFCFPLQGSGAHCSAPPPPSARCSAVRLNQEGVIYIYIYTCIYLKSAFLLYGANYYRF